MDQASIPETNGFPTKVCHRPFGTGAPGLFTLSGLAGFIYRHQYSIGIGIL
jgi:hypothetical protein